MPRIVDYASRFVFLREAAFEIVLTNGVDALSRRSLASIQGVSASTINRLIAADADLVALAAEEVEARRRRSWWGSRNEALRDGALRRIRSLVPDDVRRIPEELVWLRIVMSAQPASAQRGSASPEGSLRERYQVALRGYADPEPQTEAGPSNTHSPVLQQILDDHRDDVLAVLGQVVELLGMPAERRAETVSELHLLVDGLTWAVCTGRLRPEHAVSTLERTVDRLSRPGPVRAPLP